MRPSIAPTPLNTVSDLQTTEKRSNALLFIVIFVTVICITPLMILGGANIGFSFILGGLVALTTAVLIVWRPVLGFYIVAGCVVLVEQSSLPTPILTDNLYIFYWPPRLTGLIERPIGFLLIFILSTYVYHRLVRRLQPLRGGALFLPFLLFLLCVSWGVIHGLTTGGDFKIIVLEVRPFWYLFISYFLAYNLVSHKNHIRTLFWILILGAGVKAIQGVYIYLIVLHGSLIGHREIMSHEESFFFVAILLLVMLFCLHHCYRPQLYAALLILPCVLIALIANQRRTDYIALLVGMAVAWILIFQVKPHARKWLLVSMVTFVILGAGYVLAFSQATGGFAEPARAIVSIFHPDPTDASSNIYRSIEDYDLKYTVSKDPLLGWGFGKQFLQPVTLPNILEQDPYYLYIPHNTIYWVWMRLGPIGYFAFWYIIGAIIVRGCIIVRHLQDRYLQLVAIYVVAVTFMEVIVAFADYQLFFYRNVIYVGLLAGVLLKLAELDKNPDPYEEKGAGCP